METKHRVLRVFTVALALTTVVGCKKTGERGETTAPGKGAVLDPAKASAEAKAEFSKVAKRYESAKAAGKLSPGKCNDLSNQFRDVYKAYGKQMTVAWFNAGAVWEECGDLEKAEGIYQEIIKAVPTYDLAYNNLGVIYWNRKQESKALDYFKRAVKANKITRAPRNNLAAALRDKYAERPQSTDFAAAETHLQSVLAVDSSNRVAYENLARLYYDRGRLKDKSYLLLADLVVTQAKTLFKAENYESADIYNIQGLLFMEKQDQVNALKAFKQAAQVQPNYADAHMNIAMISIRFRDYKQAEASLTIALKDKRQKRNVETYLGLGVAERGLRKYGDAEKAFKKALDVSKSDPRGYYNLGVLYQEHIAPNTAAKDGFNKEPYETAISYYDKFTSRASGEKEYREAVADAKTRVDSIKQLFKDIKEMQELQKEVDRMAALQKKQEDEERKRLLELEKKAKAAAGGASE